MRMRRRVLFKSPKGELIEVYDDAPVMLNEWQRVCAFMEWLCDLASKERVNLLDLMICVTEQLKELGRGKERR